MDLFSLFLQSPPTSLGHLDFFQWETDASLCVPPPNFKGHILNFLKNNLSFTPGIAKSPIPAFFKSERSQSAFCRHHNIWQRAPLFWPRKRKYPPTPTPATAAAGVKESCQFPSQEVSKSIFFFFLSLTFSYLDCWSDGGWMGFPLPANSVGLHLALFFRVLENFFILVPLQL